ncbi:MAG: ABC transporter ATP-binding protein [Bacteroidaceae bacterium]|nr:ABC transporter ATP-binding protein [Bacteroidaceae bacterium]
MHKFQKFRQIITWLWNMSRGLRFLTILNTTLGITLVAADLLFVWASKLVIDAATLSDYPISLTSGCILLAAIIIAQIVISQSGRWIKTTLGVKAVNRTQRTFFSQLLTAEWQDLQKFHSGDITNRMQRDATEISQFITETFPNFLTTIVKFLGAFIFLYVMDKKLALVVVVILPIFIVISKLYIKKLRTLTHLVRTIESEIQSFLQETLQHTIVIKTLIGIDHTSQRLNQKQKDLQDKVRHKTIYTTTTSTLLNLGFATGYFLTFCWGAHSLQQGLISYGSLIAFVQLVGQVQGPIRSLTSFVPQFVGLATAVERLSELQNLPTENSSHNQPSTPLSTPLGICINKLHFAYPEGRKTLFHDYDLDIKPGSKIAIIGETGAGKTTLVRLLLALLRPTAGNISLYDSKVNTPLSADTRSYFAYLPQGNTLLSGTLRENLLMASPNASEDELNKALALACADFVFALPLGLDTPTSERGGGFSEGQAQRICIARTLLRKAPIIILDEATSSLDQATEARIISNLKDYLKETTLLFITHRPAILSICDRVVRIECETPSKP